MTHALLTIVVQIGFGLFSRNWVLGGLLVVMFYLGREVTQAEYRWISNFGDGLRANMPWWGGFDPQTWNLKSLGDVFFPITAMLCVYALSRILPAHRR